MSRLDAYDAASEIHRLVGTAGGTVLFLDLALGLLWWSAASGGSWSLAVSLALGLLAALPLYAYAAGTVKQYREVRRSADGSKTGSILKLIVRRERRHKYLGTLIGMLIVLGLLFWQLGRQAWSGALIENWQTVAIAAALSGYCLLRIAVSRLLERRDSRRRVP